MNSSKITFIIYLHLSALNYFAQPDALRVAVVGDTPYKISEWKHFRKNIANIDPNQVDFLIHVGDIKRGYMPCYKHRYKRTKKFLERSPVPYLIIPGDNEFNDCYCMKPPKAIKVWQNTFVNYPEYFALKRNDSLPENFYFEKDSILFIGINHVGGKIHDTTEWQMRTLTNQLWIEEANSVYPYAKKIIVFAHASPNNAFGLQKWLKKFSEALHVELWWVQGDIHTFTINPAWKNMSLTRAITDNGIENKGFRVLSIPTSRQQAIVFE